MCRLFYLLLSYVSSHCHTSFFWCLVSVLWCCHTSVWYCHTSSDLWNYHMLSGCVKFVIWSYHMLHGCLKVSHVVWLSEVIACCLVAWSCHMLSDWNYHVLSGRLKFSHVICWFEVITCYLIVWYLLSTVKPLDNIIETSRDLGLSEFITHAEGAGLIGELTRGGAYTVFAPTNEAIMDVSPDIL